MSKKLTTSEFQNRLNNIYGDQFIVLEEYINNETKIKIHCNKCGKDIMKAPVKMTGSEKSGCYICNKKNNYKALDYLLKRGITWDIINKYKIGYTKYDENFKQLSSRIIIPSFNKFGELNYWTGRDFTNLPKRQKYYNPIIERKNLIFNEEYVEWDADITLVEGPFDHIVVPNSIPLLGKVLKTDFKLYQYIITKANANVNIWLDSDAFEDIKKIYQLLNHDRLYGKIKFIPTPEGEDPSSVFQKFGKKGVIECLKNAKQIEEIYLG